MTTTPLFKTVALIGKYNSQEIGDSLDTLSKYFKSKGSKVLIEQQTAFLLDYEGDNVASLSEIGKNSDLAVVLGGDGTMLNIARVLAVYDVPVIGVNRGHLGFLTDLSTHNMIEHFDEILAGNYYTEDRILLQTSVIREDEIVFKSVAFNDAVIDKGSVSRLIEFEMRINNQFVYSQHSDGLIISSPTGSTAYALSAGGPIVHPSLNAIIMAPICPHTLTNRPLVVNSNSVIDIMMLHCADGRVHVDGHYHFDLLAQDCVRIEPYQHNIKLLHPNTHDYYQTLRIKLNWGFNSISHAVAEQNHNNNNSGH